MKKRFLTGLATGFLVLAMSGTSQALTIDASIVGSVDPWVASATLGNSGDQTEINWVNTALNAISPGSGTYTIADLTKTDTPVPSLVWYQVTGSGSVAYEYAFQFLSDAPDYFYIKTGNLGNGTDDHFLFQNIANLAYGVVVLTNTFSPDDTIQLGKFSHIGEVGGGSPVPEPATMLLFGTGLVGLAGIVRRKVQ